MYRLRLFLLCCLLGHLGFSQQYPVQVTTTIAPPYSVYLSDYISVGSNSLQVLINLLELDRTNLRVKLRVTIEGAGIRLQTNPSYLPPAIVLQGGVPELLTGFDIRGYLNPDHLVFSGISRSEFMQAGKLPEGFYTFTVEVIEYNRSVQVSSPMSGKANAWVMLNDPPLINLPFNGDKVRATDPQNVLFSWTPRHTASPNAAFTTEYEFRMVEMYPGQTNPDVAIRSSNSIYTVTTTQTSLNYGIIEPTLIPGKKYAFRIRAYDTSGRDLFKNQGYSETYVFQYGDACILPTQISAEVLDPNRARFEWEPETVHSGFVLQYRRAGDNHWFEKETLSSSQIIPELSGSTTYEYRVQPQCGTILGEVSPMYTFTTPEVDENAFVCGTPVPEWDMNPNPLQQPLLPLDVIKVGDWDVIVKSIHSNGDGSYAGTGYAAVPYFNLANVRVTWDRILVNEDYRVIAGHIKTVYSTESRFVMELEKEEIPLEEMDENLEETNEIIEEDDLITEAVEEGSTLEETEVSDTESGEEDPLVFEDIPDIPEEEILTPEESEALALAEEKEDGTVEDGSSLDNVEGLSRNADYVVINSITSSFKPGYGRMKLSYSIVESSELKHNKIEIFKVEEDKSLTLITTYFDVPSGEKVTFIDSQDEDKEGWAGKGTDLEFITAGQYRVVITAAKDESFKNGFEDYEVVEVKPSESTSESTYDYFVTDEDAWYRKKEAPYNLIKPEPKTNILAKGLQVAVLEVVKDDKGNEVSKLKVENTGKIEYTSFSNLTQVKSFSENRKYKVIQDYGALTIPFPSNPSNKNYTKDTEIEVDKYFGEYLKVSGEGGEIKGHWIHKSNLIWIDLVSKDNFLTETKNATTIGTKFTGNETSVACNVCVRSALLLLKEEPALFPYEGSAFYDPGKAFEMSYPKGYITNPGKAKNIKTDFDEITKKVELDSRFTELTRKSKESWEDYFKRLQTKADNGGIVVGVYISRDGSSGHVMMITPGGMVDVGDKTKKWGDSFARRDRNILKVPRVLECGTGARNNEAPLCRNVDYNGAINRLKWYEYGF